MTRHRFVLALVNSSLLFFALGCGGRAPSDAPSPESDASGNGSGIAAADATYAEGNVPLDDASDDGDNDSFVLDSGSDSAADTALDIGPTADASDAARASSASTAVCCVMGNSCQAMPNTPAALSTAGCLFYFASTDSHAAALLTYDWEDAQCAAMPGALGLRDWLSSSTIVAGTCVTVSYTGTIDAPGAQLCFPTRSYANAVVECEPDSTNPSTRLPADCVEDSIPYYDSPSGTHFCCKSLPTFATTYLTCVSGITTFGTFAYGAFVDTDMDNVPDVLDNCPTIANTNQADQDHDAVGDLCDNCPYTYNQDQAATTESGIGNACNCVLAPQPLLGQNGCLCADGGGPLVDGGSVCGLIVLEDGGLSGGG